MTETHPENRLIGYARVSTYGQTLGAQIAQLRAQIYQADAGTASAPVQDRDNFTASGTGAFCRAFGRRCLSSRSMSSVKVTTVPNRAQTRCGLLSVLMSRSSPRNPCHIAR